MSDSAPPPAPSPVPATPSARRAQLLDELMREARRTGSIGTLHNRAGADRAGLNQTDWDCLDLLDWTGPLTAGEIAKRLGLTSGAITGVLDRLERAGVARRVADPRDRRRVIVELSVEPPQESGDWMTVYMSYGKLAEEMNQINAQFDDDQLEAIVRWIRLGNEAVERSISRMRAAD